MVNIQIGENRNTGDGVNLPSKVLNRHISILGQTGSGKTVAMKVLIEEIALKGIPSLIIDVQGDLSQFILGIHEESVIANDGDLDRAREFSEKAEVRVWVPIKSKGLPLCLNPFVYPPDDLEEREVTSSIDLMAAGFTSIAGFDVSKREGKGIKAYLARLLETARKAGISPKNFIQLADICETPYQLCEHSEMMEEEFGKLVVDLISDPLRKKIVRSFRGQMAGTGQYLYNSGIPLDFETMVTPCDEKKVPINIIYMNTLTSQEAKNSFMLETGRRLYDWMIKQKPIEGETKLAFAIDEIQPFIPPYPKNPPPKSIIEMIAKQARKFGVSCIFATQNNASIDYKIFGQASTKLIGGYTETQDIKKVEHLLSNNSIGKKSLADELPKLSKGSFQLVSNHAFNEPKQVKIRWLYSKHLDGDVGLDDIDENTSDQLVRCVQRISKGEKISSNIRVGEVNDPKITINPSSKILSEDSSTTDEMKLSRPDDHFSMNLFGGFNLVKDSNDPLSVMLGITNLITTMVLIWSSITIVQNFDEIEQYDFIYISGICLSLVAVVVLFSEIFGASSSEFVEKIRQKSRQVHYLILIWLWLQWPLLREADFYSAGLIGPIEIAQTLVTSFVILELSHRLKLGKFRAPTGKSAKDIFTSGISSLVVVVNDSELNELRESSVNLLATFRLYLDGIIVLTLLENVYGLLSLEYLTSNSWYVRLSSIYVVLFMSQIISRRRTSQIEG